MDSDSMLELAYSLLDEQNIDEAIKWFKKSAELGNKDAMYELAVISLKYEQNESVALEWLKKYKDGDELEAMSYLAGLYRSDNPQKSFELYKEVSDKGGDCNYALGEMYQKGIGTEKNLQLAIKYFEKQAQIENFTDVRDEYSKYDAMLKIAEIYISLKDEKSALEWLTRRNDGNKIFGMSELAHIYYGDDEFEYEDTNLIDKAKALEWFKKLYELKDSHGAYYYGEMLESSSKSKALQIYEEGTKFGSELCFRRVIQLYLEDGNIIEAARWSV